MCCPYVVLDLDLSQHSVTKKIDHNSDGEDRILKQPRLVFLGRNVARGFRAVGIYIPVVQAQPNCGQDTEIA